MIRQTTGEKVFGIFNYSFLTLFAFATLFPFIYVLAASLSSPFYVLTGKVILWPKGITLSAYKNIIDYKYIWTGYANTIFYSVVGTVFSLFITVTGAYPLSRKRLMGRGFLTFFVALTLWFQAGMIPTYLNIRDLGLLDKRISLIIAFACTTFYVILMRTYFQSLPSSLEESAKIDGANDIRILFRIILPISKPALATIGLYYLVQKWNAWFWATYLLIDPNKAPLQVFLRKLIIQADVDEDIVGSFTPDMVSNETLIYATIVVSIIPIILVYPYIQKYFVKGIMIGSIKG